MENPKICDCPYTEWCHEPRQWLANERRKLNPKIKLEDCFFYPLIKEMEEKENAKTESK